MTYYAKYIEDNNVIALYTYDYEPHFSDDDIGIVLITKEEYDILLEELKEKYANLNNKIEDISPAKALDIILGGEIE